MIIKNIKTNKEIKDMEQWRINFFADRKAKDWVPGRSAYECAKYWLNVDSVSSIQNLLQSKISISFDEAYPECELKFDSYTHPRENDLLIISENEETLISVESKTDESFASNNFLGALKEAIEYKEGNPKSKQPERLFDLYKNYFNSNNLIFSMMHQLLYWYAGSIAEAKRRNSKNIVLLNQVFKNETHNKKKIEKNHKDFEYFAKIISNNTIDEINENEMYGPINNEYTKGFNVYLLNQVIKI